MEKHNQSASMTPPQAGGGVGAFEPGEALAALTTAFLAPGPVRRWLIDRLHPRGPECPHCGLPVSGEARLEAFWDRRRLECPQCGRWFTAFSGTILQGCKLDEPTVYLLAVYLALGWDASRIAAALNISAETVRVWRHRLHG
jgi:transposase-like protein